VGEVVVSATETEQWADWCEDDGAFAICGTRMKVQWRRSMGQRWCFRHRARHEFFRVLYVPDGLSYYGPSVFIEGPLSDCTDLFPGWYREWEE
jgi:hypothetical protein